LALHGGNYSIINANELPHITMMNHIVNDMEKLLSIMGYLDEILFERQYKRITQLIRLSIQATTIKTLLCF
jgi:hypothetical protein